MATYSEVVINTVVVDETVLNGTITRYTVPAGRYARVTISGNHSAGDYTVELNSEAIGEVSQPNGEIIAEDIILVDGDIIRTVQSTLGGEFRLRALEFAEP